MYRKNYFIFTLFIILLSSIKSPVYSQEYIFVGDPKIFLEEGNYKENYNTGMYFF